MKRNTAATRRSIIRRAVPVLVASMLLTVSPFGTPAAYALDAITAVLTAGETLSTGTEATLTDPTATSVTVPVAGTVSIAEGAVTQTAPSGRQFFGQEIDITAPLALTILDPIKMVFRFDASVLPTSATASEIRMFRNGMELSSCTGAAGTASPDPCTSSITINATTGDLEIVALTSAASRWNAGKVKASDGGGAMTVSPGSVVASSTDNDLTFTFKASTGGMDGQIEMTVPSGWSAPQSTDVTGAGHVSVTTGGCSAAPDTRLVSIVGMVVTFDMLCSIDQSFSISYANATAPTTLADHQFTTKTKLDGGTFTAIATQPKVSTVVGALSKFHVAAVGTVTAGTAFTAAVTAKDAWGNTITTYSGTPTVSHDLGASTKGCGADAASACSAAASLGTFTSGSATLTATAYKAETTRKFTITDGSIASVSGAFSIAAANASGLAITAPGTATAGTAFDATVTAYDAYGNVATGYRGTVSFRSSDAYASLPVAHAFSATDAGAKTFSITLDTAGVQSVTAEDATAALTATASVTVGDTTVPTVTISDVTPSLVKAGESATVTWSSNERGTFSIRRAATSCTDGTVLSTGSYTSGSKATPVSAADLSEGTNLVHVCVTDSGANAGGATATITKDSTAPDTVISSGPSGTINTGSVSFRFSSSDTDGALSCRIDAGDGTTAFEASGCTDGGKTYDISGLSNGTYSFAVTATDVAGNPDVTPAIRTFRLDRSIAQSDRVVADVQAGEVVSTGTQPSVSDVVVTSVQVSVAGSVTIEETSITQPQPYGWSLFGQQVNITAPPAAAFDNPLRLVFRLSLPLPSGYDPSVVDIFRNGSVVGSCSTTMSDPCFTSALTDGVLELTVLTTSPSEWTFGVRTPPPPVVPVPPPPPADVEAPQVIWTQRGRYISPNGDGRRDDMTLSATFSEPTSWDLSISPANEVGANQMSGASVSRVGSGMSVVASWSDMTIDRDLPDGTYVWTLEGEDASSNRMQPVSGVVVVDRTSPVISSIRVDPYRLRPKTAVTITFKVSEAANVRVRVKRAGSIVRTLGRKTLADAGKVTLVWRGRDEAGEFVPPGRYRLLIKAVDRGGTRTLDRSSRMHIGS